VARISYKKDILLTQLFFVKNTVGALEVL